MEEKKAEILLAVLLNSSQEFDVSQSHVIMEIVSKLLSYVDDCDCEVICADGVYNVITREDINTSPPIVCPGEKHSYQKISPKNCANFEVLSYAEFEKDIKCIHEITY